MDSSGAGIGLHGRRVRATLDAADSALADALDRHESGRLGELAGREPKHQAEDPERRRLLAEDVC